jgi:methylmalonyl-CoA/ethylmalonyl-CoA epimerase
VTFTVDDVTDTDTRLRAHRYDTTGLDVSSSAWSETFIRPKLTFRALMQSCRPIPTGGRRATTTNSRTS